MMVLMSRLWGFSVIRVTAITISQMIYHCNVASARRDNTAGRLSVNTACLLSIYCQKSASVILTAAGFHIYVCRGQLGHCSGSNNNI